MTSTKTLQSRVARKSWRDLLSPPLSAMSPNAKAATYGRIFLRRVATGAFLLVLLASAAANLLPAFYGNLGSIWLAQALGVLWYWWAVHEQRSIDEELKTIQGSSAANGQLTSVRKRLEVLHDHWMHVIGYWGMVASTPQFWESLEAANGLPVSAVRERFVAQLKSRLRE